MRGFGRFTSASRFCRAFDEGRQFFRIRTAMTQPVSLRQQREMVRQRLAALQALVQAASSTKELGEKRPTRFVCFLSSQF
jgi:hypothetical protein